MERTYVKDMKEKMGGKITACGFVQTIRDQGGIVFLLIRDATGIVQAVALKKQKEVFSAVKDLSLESVVEISGEVKEEPQAPDGVEIALEELNVLSKAAPELPIPVVEKGGDETEASKRFDWRWIDLRKPEKKFIFDVWTELEKGCRDYFYKNNYVQIYTPSFMTTPSEGGAEVFEVDYFERKAYLAQSPQFYKQMAMAAGFEKVFVVGPVYRAEPSFTTRHMTEFTGWDFEISYIDSHHQVMAELENMLISGFRQVQEALRPAFAMPEKPFPKVTMAEAKKKLKEANVASKCDFDVSPEEERELCRIIKEETNYDFVFLTDWPIEGRPFYHMRCEDNPKLTKSFDLLCKGVEVVTGAQREHRVEFLEKQALDRNVDADTIKDYLDFFRYGCPPHGGVGIGPARLIAQMLDLPSVKEATFLPRDVKRLSP